MSDQILQIFALLTVVYLINGKEKSSSVVDCDCIINTEETTADCSRKKLLIIPDCVPNTTETLIFNHNFLQSRPKQFERFRYLNYLDLSNNYCPPVSQSFKGLSRLKVLYLQQNDIYSIQRQTFNELVHLETLSLSTNHIQSLTQDSFAELVNLRFLDLSYNELTVIRNHQFSNLSKLTYLDLSYCYRLQHLYDHSFVGLSGLKYLSLGHHSGLNIHVQEIGLEIFEPLTSLESLHMEGLCGRSARNSSCSQIDQMIKRVPSLKKLHVDDFMINNLGPGFLSLKKLEELYFRSATGGEFKVGPLNKQTFKNLKTGMVSKLVIYNSMVVDIYPDAFVYLKQLTSLELVIKTRPAECDSVYTGVLSGLYNTNIKHIRLSVYCQGVTLDIPFQTRLEDTELASLDLSHGSLVVLHSVFFRHLPTSLEYLFVDHNWISFICPTVLSEVENISLVSLDLSDEYVIQQARKNETNSTSLESQVPYICPHDAPCYTLPYSLKYINISHSSLLCSRMYDICDSNNSLIFLNASYQRNVECFDKFWTSLRNLGLLENLDLRGNRIKIIPSDAFAQQRHLKYLSLSNTGLLSISFDIQSLELKELDFSNNSIRYLPVRFTKKLDLIAEKSNLTLYFGDNPLVCDCKRIKFVAWLRETHVIYEKNKLSCNYRNGTETQLSNIKTIHNSLKDECVVFEVTVVCAVSFFALNILLGLTALIWHRRWRIKYLLSIAKRNVSPYHPLEDREIQLEYDVYISYERDFNLTAYESLHEFVALKVYPALQNQGFKVLIRDELDIGMKMYDVISGAIRRSKKVVVFLSRDYCSDYWNVFEFNLAVMEGIYTKRQVVIPVTFENLGRNDLHDEVYAFLNAEPVPRYRRDMSDSDFINYLCDQIRYDRRLD